MTTQALRQLQTIIQAQTRKRQEQAELPRILYFDGGNSGACGNGSLGLGHSCDRRGTLHSCLSHRHCLRRQSMASDFKRSDLQVNSHQAADSKICQQAAISVTSKSKRVNSRSPSIDSLSDPLDLCLAPLRITLPKLATRHLPFREAARSITRSRMPMGRETGDRAKVLLEL